MKWGMLLALPLVNVIFFVSLAESQNVSESCDPSLTNCSGKCVDATSDLRNCGLCGISCSEGDEGGGATCVNGECICNNTLDTKCFREGNNGGGDYYCTNTLVDSYNCGTCAVQCSEGYCRNGECVSATAESVSTESVIAASIAERVCPDPAYPTVCNGECVNTTSDPFNCGNCGIECDRAACLDGSCILDSNPLPNSMKPSARKERESRN